MVSYYVGWAISAAILVGIAVLLGNRLHDGPLGIFIDNRGRYSLSQLQLVLWTILILSLFAGFFWGRLWGGSPQTALSFNIPQNLLFVFGISLASTATAIATKSFKDNMPGSNVAHSVPASPDDNKRPFFAQVFLVEEGAMSDKAVDVTKFQQFWVTLVLIAAYTALAIGAINSGKTDSLPDFNQQIVLLLGISHTGYIAGKIPQRAGEPPNG